MLLSMTGYGKGQAMYNGRKIIAEIKSLNSKNLDITTHVAAAYSDRELLLRQMVKDSADRGKVDISVRIEDSDAMTAATINRQAVASYKKQICEICQAVGINEPTDWWTVISRLPGLTQAAEPILPDDEEWASVRQAVEEALANLKAFRAQEGLAVKKKFEDNLRHISDYLAEIERYETQRITKIRQQITERLNSLNVDYDHNRLEEEMIYYIEKLDVNEEKQRLANHLRYFSDTMEQNLPQGKKLGFIAQEMGREINTLGSKSNNAEMQKIVVKMKDELEQIKEQVLNVL